MRQYSKPRHVGLASGSSGNRYGRGGGRIGGGGIRGAGRGGSVGVSRARNNWRESENVEGINLDHKQDVKALIGDILENITKRDGISNKRRLDYLNEFVKVLENVKIRNKESASPVILGWTVEALFLCLRVCLVNEAPVIRMGALRVLRHLAVTEEDLIVLNATQLPYLIVRSLDIKLNNIGERTQAIQLCQKILAIPNGAAHFPCSITRSLVALGFDGEVDQDKLHVSSLSLLCQLALLNPMLFIECGGVRVLLHNILGFTSPMVLEAMIGSLLHLLNVPETRDAAGVNLQSLVAPFTDVHFKLNASEKQHIGQTMDEREVGYQCAKTAIATVLKSWSGIAHFCQSLNSGLQALIDALYIEQLEIRKTILELICEIIGVKFPTWSDEVSVALSAVDPSSPKDSWKLQEGFVVQEALSVLPHLAVSTPNITANHMALIVSCFIQRGLLEALVEVIVTGDTFICVRGTVLLGELLSLVDRYIPLECYDPSQFIPTLMNYSAGIMGGKLGSSTNASLPQQHVYNTNSKGNLNIGKVASAESRQQRAMEAVSVLNSLQRIKSCPPTPSSAFLQAQLQYAGYASKRHPKFQDRLGQVQLNRLLKRDMESNPTKLLKETGVLNSKDSTTWQWETILTLIQWAPTSLKRVDDSSWRSFLKRLVDYYKPSSNVYARVELGKEQSRLLAKVGCSFIEFLADEVENFSGITLLEELLVDISAQLDEVNRSKGNIFGCFLSPFKLESTLTQTYFLFVGKLSHTSKGFKMLERGEILRRLYDLINNVPHEHYIKLIVSSLSYREEYCKRILTAALTCSEEGSRLYATQFLRVLVRDKLPDFSKWGIDLLVNQLGDQSKSVSLAALDILEEAIHDKMFLESLISAARITTLSSLGDRGTLLLVCFPSRPSGFKFLHQIGFLQDEINNWKLNFNKRYVELVEVLVRDSVSSLRRGDDGKYPERASRNQEMSKFVDIYVPPHLYGQLVQHKDGLDLLMDSGDIDGLMTIVNEKKCTTADETRELKAALWALAHFGTSIDGVQILEEGHVLEAMVELGRFCPILSVRHTVFHCLCLLCVTQQGGDILRKYGWYAMPRNHHESYTLWAPEFFNEIKTQELRTRREEELLQQAEGEEDDEKVSVADTFSNMIEEDAELFMMEEDLNLNPPLEMKESPNFGLEDDESESLAVTVSLVSNSDKQQEVVVGFDSGSSSRKLSHVHHRSQSDSQTLVLTKISQTNFSNQGKDKKEDPVEVSTSTPGEGLLTSGSMHPRTSSSGSTGGSLLRGMKIFKSVGGSSTASGSYPGRSGSSWRWRKNKSDSSSDCTTSGVSSCDSLHAKAAMQPSADHVQTLSPIPSSASIATDMCSELQENDQASRGQLVESPEDSSRLTMTEPIGNFGRPYMLSSSYGSPSHTSSLAYRSIKIKRPVVRMPMLSDSDIYPSSSSWGGRRTTGGTGSSGGSILREMKTGSLDRHFILSPGALFGESKLMRVNSSMTSLSTPSFRMRPESETKGPCYMGLCLPKDFQAIFLTDSSIPLHVRMASFQDESGAKDGDPNNLHDSFEFHTPTNCMGCYKFKGRSDLDDDSSAVEEKSLLAEDTVDDGLEADPCNLPGTATNVVESGPTENQEPCTGAHAGDEKSDKKIAPDSPEGQAMIRKEVLRLISNLISSVNVHSNEQGILRLKQKFPQVFRDLCLYTEVLNLISRYNIRLCKRRFVQEVFYDIPFDEFYKVANQVVSEGGEEESQSEASHVVQLLLPLSPPLEDEGRTAFNEERQEDTVKEDVEEQDDDTSGDDLTTTESDILDLK